MWGSFSFDKIANALTDLVDLDKANKEARGESNPDAPTPAAPSDVTSSTNPPTNQAGVTELVIPTISPSPAPTSGVVREDDLLSKAKEDLKSVAGAPLGPDLNQNCQLKIIYIND